MWQDISEQMARRMCVLEEMDAKDRSDGTTRLERLRQIPPETGKFVSLLAASAPTGLFIEVGTSAGYSTMWIALACQARGCRITTHEILPRKVAMARDTFLSAGIEDVVELVQGNALDFLPEYKDIAFCFLDAEKEVYAACYEMIIPNMVQGGILVADNAINHEATLRPMLDRALSDPRVDAMIVPIGKGELVCRKI
jgi:predicted O-methyltransferase YrrM